MEDSWAEKLIPSLALWVNHKSSKFSYPLYLLENPRCLARAPALNPCQAKFDCYPWTRERVQPQARKRGGAVWGHENRENVRRLTSNSFVFNKRPAKNREVSRY